MIWYYIGWGTNLVWHVGSEKPVKDPALAACIVANPKRWHAQVLDLQGTTLEPHCEVDDDECSGTVTQGCYLGPDLWFCQGHRTNPGQL